MLRRIDFGGARGFEREENPGLCAEVLQKRGDFLRTLCARSKRQGVVCARCEEVGEPLFIAILPIGKRKQLRIAFEDMFAVCDVVVAIVEERGDSFTRRFARESIAILCAQQRADKCAFEQPLCVNHVIENIEIMQLPKNLNELHARASAQQAAQWQGIDGANAWRIFEQRGEIRINKPHAFAIFKHRQQKREVDNITKRGEFDDCFLHYDTISIVWFLLSLRLKRLYGRIALGSVGNARANTANDKDVCDSRYQHPYPSSHWILIASPLGRYIGASASRKR